jgi:cell wall-associated NlpC family hydrolase
VRYVGRVLPAPLRGLDPPGSPPINIMMRLRLFVPCALALMAAGCASSNAVPRPFPGAPVASAPGGASAGKPATPSAPVAPNAPLAPPASASAPKDGATADRPLTPSSLTSHRYDGRAVAEFALAFRGVPYRMGGADPAGFDCSGLVQYVFAQYGISVPRVVEQQWGVGDKVKPSNIKAGDLLFFSTKGPGASHVAIALDAERFVHAPNSTGVVRVEALTSTYWGSHYLGARRINKSTTSN